MQRTVIAIHQPNYSPWLGYFHKIAKSDLFVFLDDVQFSKNSYINRVEVLSPGGRKWLTLPVSYSFGDPVHAVQPARANWIESHLSTLKNYYRQAPFFKEMWPETEQIYHSVDADNLAEINIQLIQGLCRILELETPTVKASSLNYDKGESDVRLVNIIKTLSDNASYLSGKGGQNYQSEDLFESNNITLQYSSFKAAPYNQGQSDFTPGLSVLDSLFHIGLQETKTMIK
ncbi:WbqC family protein [Kiloniella sp. b19]|uniref:WbqC family protein n=1 Tax=Kiloniella sp. GXU_MW_B19 TaxID=3141326 RepID=UPI0031D8A4AC